jgi:hypothetical protein
VERDRKAVIEQRGMLAIHQQGTYVPPWISTYKEQCVTELEQRTITFYGDELIAIQDQAANMIYVPLARLCDNLGIERKRQAQRIRNHPVLKQGLIDLTLDTGGGRQSAQCLRIDLIPLWLAGVNANRVGEDVRDKLIVYQAEVATVLWQAFKHDIVPAAELAAQERPKSGAELALDIATAIQHLAQQQLELERSFEGVQGRMDSMARFMRDFVGSTDRRLSALELHLNPQEQLTETQAGELALAVKAVGQALSGPDRTKNGYPQVYAELYRRYRISSYKNLPQGKFNEAMTWLHQWHQELTSESTGT